jgi:hypothetical protein
MKIRRLSLIAALLASFACPFQRGVAQQATPHVIHRLPVEANEPLAITEVKASGQSVTLDQVFTANEEWLKTLTVSVKNNSDKVIVYAAINLQFPRYGSSHDRTAIFEMFYGSWTLQTRRPARKEISVGIQPGKTVEIHLSPSQFADLSGLLLATGYLSPIEKVAVGIGPVIFADDMMWYAGAKLRRDSSDPTLWINAGPKPQ